MNKQVYAFALKNTLNEIKNICPDISHAFIFKKDGKIIAKDENTSKKNINNAVDAFDAITERADAIGGLESVTFHGANGRVNIACINDFYLTTIASKEADEKYVNTLTRVLVPTVLKLVEKIHPASIEDDTLTTLKPEPAEDNDADEITEDAKVCEKELLLEETDATEPEPEPLLPEPPVNQFIVENLGGFLVPSDTDALKKHRIFKGVVENLGGFLVPSDTVRIDSAVIVQWKDLYADKKIEEVDVETLNGKTTRCKFKPIKGSKYEGKGVIQMPEKIQLTLQTTKGELVMVKPVVE
jgi:predicted regulator of Ras-like GTPase activity (Roadblock/LC7/MglB family)